MRIGDIIIENGVLLAPMEDVTDESFRIICRKLGADIVYTEFINSDGLIRNVRDARRKLRIMEEERPVAIQIYGWNLDAMVESSRIAEEVGPDFLDINCGCWVKNVAMRGAGAGLLRDIPAMERMASEIVKAVKLPVTLKTRLGWDSESIKIIEVAKRMEAVGIQALTIHCRTRSQGHAGAADWSWIPKVKREVNIPIILNGDVVTALDVKRAFDETGCDAVMIARGAIANPWVFSQAKALMTSGAEPVEPPIEEKVRLCLEHLERGIAWKGERKGIFEHRKHYTGYLKGLPGIAKLRAELMKIETFAEVRERLEKFLEEVHLEEVS